MTDAEHVSNMLSPGSNIGEVVVGAALPFDQQGEGGINKINLTDAPTPTEGRASLAMDMMPLQQKIIMIEALIKEHNLYKEKYLAELLGEGTVKTLTLLTANLLPGYFLLVGPQSSGKTSSASRIMQKWALVSSKHLGSRAPVKIVCSNSLDDSKGQINLVLPQVKNGQTIIHEERTLNDISSEQCLEEIKAFHKVIEDKGKEDIVSDEIELHIFGCDVPNLVLLDIPGLAGGNTKVSKISRDILKKYLKCEVINPLLCFNAGCDDHGGFEATLKTIGDAGVLGDSILVINKIDKSEDDDWENTLDESNPDAKLDGPLWKLKALLGGEYPGAIGTSMNTIKASIGLFNKNTIKRDQAHLKIQDQDKVEDNWIKKAVENGSVSPDEASRLGLNALFSEMDQYTLIHHQGFLKKSHADALFLLEQHNEAITGLGIAPSEIDTDELQAYVEQKLAVFLKEAIDASRDKIKDIWKKCSDEEESLAKSLKKATAIFLDANPDTDLDTKFCFELEVVVACKVSEAFYQDSTGGGMQIRRFDDLRKHYVNASEILVKKFFQAFKETIEFDLKLFNSLIKFGVGDENAKIENLINVIIDTQEADILKPVFANLHEQICQDGAIWDAQVENHADRREKLNKNLQVLKEVVNGLEELIELTTDEFKEASKHSSLSPPATPQRSSTRIKKSRSTGKRGKDGEKEDTESATKMPRTNLFTE